MTREQIEKAAIKFAKSHYLEKYGNMNAEITEDEFDALVRSIAYMFMHGAQWRINSVWHDASEKPNGNNKCLVELRIPGRRNPTYKLWTWGWENSFVTRWAYIDDLLPERKEDER